MNDLLGLAILFSLKKDSGVSDEEYRASFRDRDVKRVSGKGTLITFLLCFPLYWFERLAEDYFFISLLFFAAFLYCCILFVGFAFFFVRCFLTQLFS